MIIRGGRGVHGLCLEVLNHLPVSPLDRQGDLILYPPHVTAFQGEEQRVERFGSRTRPFGVVDTHAIFGPFSFPENAIAVEIDFFEKARVSPCKKNAKRREGGPSIEREGLEELDDDDVADDVARVGRG